MTKARTRSAACGVALLTSLALSAGAAAAPARFARTLKRQGVTFKVTCANQGSINELEIRTSGLTYAKPIVRRIEGSVTGAEVADLDANGRPELYVYVTSAGSGSYGSVVGYAANKRKSLTAISMAPIASHAKASKGYRGHEAFKVRGGALVRSFPVYEEGDPNAAPTGGKREVHYKLVAGEAGWVLEPGRIVE